MHLFCVNIKHQLYKYELTIKNGDDDDEDDIFFF